MFVTDHTAAFNRMGRINTLLSSLAIVIVLFTSSDLTTRVQAFRMIEIDGVTKVLALENETVPIVCITGVPLAYCGFVHPSGKRLSFSGHTLIDGKCAVKIRATPNDSGIWKCHIGKTTIGEEIEQTIEVRISGKLASIEKNVTVTHGKDVTLACVTTKERMPLKYCRFEPPDGVPFSIDAGVKPSRPILDRYYYPENLSTDRGDCAVTIVDVQYKDMGVWTCGAGLDDGQEHTAVIRVDVQGLYTITTASNAVVVICLPIVAILVILGVVAWKRRTCLGATPVGQAHQVIEIQEFGPRPRQSSPGQRSTRSLTPARESKTVPAVIVQSPSPPHSKTLSPL